MALQLQPPPYQSAQGSVQWNEWFRIINDLMDSIAGDIGEIANVTITSGATGDVLIYNATTALWENGTEVTDWTVDDELTAGDIVVTGAMDVEGGVAFGDSLTLTSTDAGAAAAPTLTLIRDSASPADGDVIGLMQWQGESSASTARQYASVQGTIVTATDGAEDGHLDFYVMEAGTPVKVLSLGGLVDQHGVDIIGDLEITHTSTHDDDHGMELTLDAAGFGGVAGFEINYITGALAATDSDAAILINIDETATSAGTMVGLEVLATAGSATNWAVLAGATVGPIQQFAGVFANPTAASEEGNDILAAISSGGAGNVAIFNGDNEVVIIEDSVIFEEMSWELRTGSSGGGIQPKFEYSTGSGTWQEFAPEDGTDGMRHTGVIAWSDGQVSSPAFAVGATGNFMVRVTRQRNSLSVTPVVDTIQTSNDTEFSWDKDGDVLVRQIKTTQTGDIEGALSLGSTLTLGGTVGCADNFFEDIESLHVGDEAHDLTISGATVETLVAAHADGASDLGEILSERHSETAGLGGHYLVARSRGNEASKAIVQDGDVVGRLNAVAYDGTDYTQLAEIRAEVDGGPGAEDMPGRWVFLTTADGAASPTERMRISADGTVKVVGALDAEGAATFASTIDAEGAVTAQTTLGVGGALTDGTLHVQAGTAGVIAASTGADILVLEGAQNDGLTILTPDASTSRINLGSPADNSGAIWTWSDATKLCSFGTAEGSGTLKLQTAGGVSAMTIDASQNTILNGTLDAEGAVTINSTLAVEGAIDSEGVLSANAGRINIVGGTPVLEFSDITASADDYRILVNADSFNIEGDLSGAETFGTEIMAVSEANIRFAQAIDAEGVVTFNAATHTIVGNATVEGSLLAMAEATDEHVLTFNAGTETWEPQAGGGGTVGAFTTTTPVATTSGTSATISSIPSGTNFITLNFNGISHDGTSDFWVQLGTSAGTQTSGYQGSSSAVAGASTGSTAYTGSAFIVTRGGFAAGTVFDGTATFTLEDATNFGWAGTASLASDGATANFFSAGVVELAGEIDRIVLTSASGDTLDAGTISIIYGTSTTGATALAGLSDVTTEAMGATQDGYLLGWNDSAEVWEDQQGMTNGTAVEMHSGSPTAVGFTGIPAGTSLIHFAWVGKSTSGTSPCIIQLGDSGGYEATGYLGTIDNTAGSASNPTTGFGVQFGAAGSSVNHGSVTLVLVDVAQNLWSATGSTGFSNAGSLHSMGGRKALSGTLDRVQITTVGGTDTYDAGDCNIVYR